LQTLYQGSFGEILQRGGDTLVLEFPAERKICSTSPLNGGLAKGIRAIFNQTTPKVETASELPGGNLEAYLTYIADQLGFNANQASGLLTAANQRNVAFNSLGFRELEVLAVATAGVDYNGGRAGDPAAYYETKGRFELLHGTVNLLLSINADLSPGAMLRGIMTATEAKSAALLELLAPSCYSKEIATGSGTDGVILAADPDSKLYLTDGGLHSKLGELIGITVKKTIKEALALETGFTPKRQLNVLARLKRFRIDENVLWTAFQEKYGEQLSRKKYLESLATIVEAPRLVALVSCLLHLADQVRWGLLPEETALETAFQIIETEIGSGDMAFFFERNNSKISIEAALVKVLSILISQKAGF